MEAQAGMLARLFERSMGLGPEWEVSDVWFEERDGAPDELHVRVAHVRGQAGGRPSSAPSAGGGAASTTRGSAPGATSTSGSTRRSSTAPCPGRTARSTASAPCACPGR